MFTPQTRHKAANYTGLKCVLLPPRTGEYLTGGCIKIKRIATDVRTDKIPAHTFNAVWPIARLQSAAEEVQLKVRVDLYSALSLSHL